MSGKREGGGSSRRTRVEHGMRDTLTELIASDVKDPRVREPTMLTVTRVELNIDLSVARCYISIVHPDEAAADAALEGLQKAAGFLRGPLGRRLGLQRAPELRFLMDPSLDVSEKLAAIVREDEERARAAGRDPAGGDVAGVPGVPGEPGAPAEAMPRADKEGT